MKLVRTKFHVLNLLRRILNLVVATVAFSSLVVSAAEDDKQQEERWFEVEVIAFKPAVASGLQEESWSPLEQIELPTPLIDFLKPVQKITPEQDNNNSFASPSTGIEEVQTVNSHDELTTANSAASTLETAKNTTQEVAFQPLSSEQLQLTAEAQTLARDPAYTLLLHTAWRQPVTSLQQAQWVRIAGGADLSAEFSYDGLPVIEINSPQSAEFEQNEIETTQNEYPKKETSALNEQKQEFPDKEERMQDGVPLEHEQSDNMDADPVTSGNTSTEVLINDLPWVPELDGAIQIYLKRYLHVNLQLYWRTPQQQEVPLAAILDSDNSELNLFNEQSETSTALGANTDSVPTQRSESLQLDWQIGDDFLTSKPKATEITRLMSYPLRQSRRMRSGELHYIDHPLIGVLIRVTPYEKESQNSDDSAQSEDL